MAAVRKATKSVNYAEDGTDYRTYKCRYCSKTFRDNSSWHLHMQLHTSTELFECDQCSYTTNIRKYLSRHKQVHLPPTLECEACGKCFRNNEHLDRHMRVHTGERPYKCAECGKTFTARYTLQSHMYIHTNKKPYKCSFCKYACRDNSTLRKHEERHAGVLKTYECSICHKIFKENRRLKDHVQEVHFGIDIRKHQCIQCNMAFKMRCLLIRHVQTVHEKTLVAKCQICNRIFNKFNLAMHMRRHVSIKPYKCTFSGCKKRFVSKSEAGRHSIIHYPDLQYPCDVCGKLFARRIRLDKHLTTHMEKKKCVECDYCGALFYSKKYLIKHIGIKHSADKETFVCDICGLRARNKPGLVMHLRYSHLRKDKKCNLCGATFKRHEYLKLHLLRTHNVRLKTMRKGNYKKIKVQPLKIKEEIEYSEDQPEIELMEIEKQEKEEGRSGAIDTDSKMPDSDIELGFEVELEITRASPEPETEILKIEYDEEPTLLEPTEENILTTQSNVEPDFDKEPEKDVLEPNREDLEPILETIDGITELVPEDLEITNEMLNEESILEFNDEDIREPTRGEEIEPILEISYGSTEFSEVFDSEITNEVLNEESRLEFNVEDIREPTRGEEIEPNSEISKDDTELVTENSEITNDILKEESRLDFDVEDIREPNRGILEISYGNTELVIDDLEITNENLKEQSISQFNVEEDISEPSRGEEIEPILEISYGYTEFVTDGLEIPIQEEFNFENLKSVGDLNTPDLNNLKELNLDTRDDLEPNLDDEFVSPVENTHGSIENVKSDEISNKETKCNELELTKYIKEENNPVIRKPAIKHRRNSILQPKYKYIRRKLANQVEKVVRFAKNPKSLPNPDLELALNQAIESVQNLVPERDDIEPIDVEPEPIRVENEIEIKQAIISLPKIEDIKTHVIKRRRRKKKEPIKDKNLEPPKDIDDEMPRTNIILEPRIVRDLDFSDTVIEYSEGVYSEDINRSIALRHRREKDEPENTFDKLFIDHAMQEPLRDAPVLKVREPSSEPPPGPDATMEYSQRVLSEDITQSIAHRDSSERANPESALDSLFIEHVLEKSEKIVVKKKKIPKHVKVCKEQEKKVDKLVKKIVTKSRARQIKTDTLERARQDYNSRIEKAVMASNKKDPINIKYFKNKPTERRQNDDDDNNRDVDNHDTDNHDDADNHDDDLGSDENDDNTTCNENNKKTRAGKIKFCTHQCYICFKLFKTKSELTQHCKDHFDICSEMMLKKCPYCGYVTNRTISTHLRRKHNIKLKYKSGINERKNGQGSKYMYEMERGFILEVIPSVKNLNRRACMKIDAEKRVSNNKTMATRKLVKKGKEWVVEKQQFKVNNDYLLPKFNEKEIKELKIDGDSYENNLRQLGVLAKRRGLKMLFPCKECEKICLKFSALVLHKRVHEVNPKAFKPKVWKARTVKKKRKIIEENDEIASSSKNRTRKSLIENRYAKPNPIVNRHKCDAKLMKFYEENIKGKDIEFWQFLKIFNKMDREHVNDFNDLESRTDLAFGIHVNNVENQRVEDYSDKNIVVTINSAEIQEIIGVPTDNGDNSG